MQVLRGQLKRLEKLSYLRDRKASKVESIRNSKFYNFIGLKNEQTQNLRKANLELNRVEQWIRIEINNLHLS